MHGTSIYFYSHTYTIHMHINTNTRMHGCTHMYICSHTAQYLDRNVMKWTKAIITALGILIFTMISYTQLHLSSSNSRTIVLIHSQDFTNTRTNYRQYKMTQNELRDNRLRIQSQSLNESETGTTAPTAPKPHDEKRDVYMTEQLNYTTTKRQHNMSDYIIPRAVVSTADYKAPESTGYVMAVNYWEQQTSGSRNLQNLQCWAGQLNVRVVEPFFSRAIITSPLITPLPDKLISFGDFFNLSDWNQNSRRHNHSELESWNTFLRDAPRQVIIVRFNHVNWNSVEENRKNVHDNPSLYPLPSDRHKTGCSTSWPKETNYLFFRQHRFLTVREVCFNFMYGDRITNRQFVREIYGENSPSTVTVVFRTWRGTGSAPRILVSDSNCYNTNLQLFIPPSVRVVRDAQQYIDTYLDNTNYIAIMARMEKTKITLRRPGIIHDCFQKIIQYWTDTKKEANITNKTFLSIDIGKYGSNSFQTTGDETDLKTEFKNFVANLYGGALTVHDWEHTFEEVTGTNESGYIALVQKVVVSKAKCVIFVGGGSFQTHAHNLYTKNHPTPASQCVRVVSECTPAKFAL